MYGPTTLTATAIVLPLLGVIAVGSRFYVRLRLKPTFIGIDDWMITFSCLLVYASGANQVVGATLGVIGREKDEMAMMDPQRHYVQAKCNYAVLIAEKVTYSCIKISVLLFYRRIFTTPTFRLINNILIVLTAAWGIIFLFTETFLCSSTSNGGEPCPSSEWRALWFAITDVITDIAVLAMPYPMIKKLQMNRKDKIGLICIFLLGGLSLIAGIVRLGFVAERFHVFFHPSDIPANAAPPFWTTVEISIGILAACLPPLGPLIRRVPNPSRIYESVKGNLGLHSSTARSLKNVTRPGHVLEAGWINLPDSKRSAGSMINTVDGNKT